MTSLRLEFCEKVGLSAFGDGRGLILAAEVSVGDVPVENAVIRISSVPPFIRPAEAHLDHLAPFSVTDVRPFLDIMPDTEVMGSLTEAADAVVTLTLEDGSGAAVSSVSAGTGLIPYRFWAAGHSPCSVASFVMPRDESLVQLRGMMSETLVRWGRDGDPDGYRGDVNRVQDLGAAAFAVLRRFGIAHSPLSEGFEVRGHEVSLPGEVLARRKGSCLDLSLLYCSLLESVGINTVAFVSEGTVYAGFWLIEDHLRVPLCTDPAVFAGRVRSGEMRAVDCSMIASDIGGDFSAAAGSALSKLGDADSFMYGVDIAAARSVFGPLPVRTADGWSGSASSGDRGASAGAEGTVQAPLSASARIGAWGRELLDAVPDNDLISIGSGPCTFPLLVTDGQGLADAFSDGTAFALEPVPEGSGRSVPAGPWVSDRSCAGPDDLRNARLRTPFDGPGTVRAARTVMRRARTEIEETGCSALFLGIGALRWSSPRYSGPRYAPLVLIPAEIIATDGGYAVRRYDEEVMFNFTLLEFLRQEFGLIIGGLEDAFRGGRVDIGLVLQAVRRAVSVMDGWDAVHGACLGVFGTAGYLMWKHLGTYAEALTADPLARCIAEGTVLRGPAEPGTNASPYGLCLALPADGSQIRAVRAAADGCSFVLDGPPGSGKSQTIADIITDSLYRGKTVLFVSGKRAALDSVWGRLEQAGIGNHCLELHSDRTGRERVLGRLKASLDACRPVDTGKLEELVRGIERERQRLDAYPEALHTPGPSGLSPYDCIVRSMGCASEGIPDLRIPDGFAAGMVPGDTDGLAETASQAAEAYSLVSDLDTPLMRNIRTVDTSPDIDAKTEQALERARSAFRTFSELADVISACGIEVDTADPSVTAASVRAVMSVPVSSVRDADLPGTAEIVRRLQSAVREVSAAAADFGDMFSFQDPNRMDALAENVRSVSVRLEERGFRCGSAVLYQAVTGASACRRRLTSDLQDIRSVWKEQMFRNPAARTVSVRYAEASKASLLARRRMRQEFMNSVLPFLRAPGTSFEQLAQSAPKISPFCEGCDGLAEQTARIASLCTDLIKELDAQQETIRGAAAQMAAAGISPSELPQIRAKIDSLSDSALAFTRAAADLSDACAALDAVLCSGRPTGPSGFGDLADVLEKAHGRMSEWASWNVLRLWFEERGLGSFIEAVRAGRTPEEMRDGAYSAVYRQVFDDARRRSEALRLFSSRDFEKNVDKFRDLDERYILLNRRVLRYRLFLNTPQSLDGSVTAAEASLLYRTVNNAPAGTTVGRLIRDIPDLLPRICPCLLMSPRSVARYLTDRFPPFDIVIFDEQSRIPTAEAIGVLARGRTCIVAGDPMQLPPARPREAASFLDDCIAAGMPVMHLEHHYRSRHGSLIAFSDRMFYGGRMFTFPSTHESEGRVSFVKVGGGCPRVAGTNPAEADAVAEELRRMVTDPVLPQDSVGIIALTPGQRSEIEDRIDDMRGSDPAFAKALGALREPLFVKDPETVQGDDRDVILVSVGFGPDRRGRVLQDFGPIGCGHGDRMLNVISSRARRSMAVFSSIAAEDVRTVPASPPGAVMLREFLGYAGNGGVYGTRAPTRGGAPSAIILDAAAALEARGYRCRTCAGSVIDMGVADPDDPSGCILGILGDGGTYRDRPNTRDREFALADVLRGMGWNIARLWSVEWYFRRDRVVEDLVGAIETARSGISGGLPGHVGGQSVLESFGAELPPLKPSRRAEYIPVSGSDVPVFEDPLSDQGISAICGTIIAAESPIQEEHLIRTFQQVTGMKRLSPRQRDSLVDRLRRSFLPVETSGFVTYWRSGSDPTVLPEYRVPSDPSKAREIDYIPLPELLSAFAEAAESYGPFDRVSAPRILATMFGFSRPGERIRQVAEEVLEIAVGTGVLKEEGGRFVRA